jgi:hypothetical protein
MSRRQSGGGTASPVTQQLSNGASRWLARASGSEREAKPSPSLPTCDKKNWLKICCFVRNHGPADGFLSDQRRGPEAAKASGVF